MYEGRADQYDDVLNQFYAKARMYDAENKRFTQEDPARDDKGNIGLMLSPGVGVGTPAVGTGGTITITAADTIYDLKEWGGSAGISASPKYYP